MFCLAVCMPVMCSAAIIHIPGDQPTIQAGINASIDGDTILLADGTYTGAGNRDMDFNGKIITVTSESGPDACVIDCQGTVDEKHRAFTFDDQETEQALIHGLTIRNGYERNGGAIYCYFKSSPTISNCVFSHNSGGVIGGAIYLYSLCTPTITNCVFMDNWGSNCGAGICCDGGNPTVINCTFTGNSIDWHKGAAIYCGASGTVNPLIVTNCIFWNNWPDAVATDAGHPIVTYSNIDEGIPGIGNIHRNPVFLSGQNCQLAANSPCIDAGTSRVAPDQDILGNSRPGGREVDMGAYEYPGYPAITRVNVAMPSHAFHPGDPCRCTATVWNTGSELQNHNLFVVLNVLDQFYFAPTFAPFDSFTDDFQEGETVIPILPTFSWPSGVGSLEGAVWYGLLTNYEVTRIIGEIGIFDFGWSD